MSSRTPPQLSIQLFEVGSVTKTMTALLVLQHVERGQIQLDDPAVDYLPALGYWADGGACTF